MGAYGVFPWNGMLVQSTLESELWLSCYRRNRMDMPLAPNNLGRPGVVLLVVRPHPDDESSATGSMLAYYHARGMRTGVVICTGGEEGEIHDPDLDPVADKPRLRDIREREVREACAILGVTELRLLGYRDSGMPGTPANQHPDAFTQANPAEAAGRLVQIIRALRPLVMVTEPPGGGYSHPDHIKCHQVSVDAFHAAGDARVYPAAGPAWQVAKLYAVAQIDDGQWETLRPEFKAAGFDLGTRRRRHRDRAPGPETATVALDVRAYSEFQRQALLAHRTQVPRDSFWVRLPEALRRRAFATAYFQRLYPPTTPGEHEADLCDGLDGQVGTG
jgi:LmbE family N-acetylglucosaminyl deacetylase